MTLIRLAKPADAKGILNIYAPYIRNTSFTFETEVPSIEEFAERIKNNLLNWPWLVCEIDGIIAGYAYATRHRERTAYQWCTESSVYIHDDYQRAGIARALYVALFEILKKQGFRNVYAVINLPNDKSVTFHESCSFQYFATYEKVGYKLGKWKNVGWWKLSLNEYGDEPAAPIKFSEMDRLTKEGYNPFIKSQELSKDCDTINTETPILEALKSVYSKIEVSSRTKTDIKFMLSSVGWKIRSMYIIPFFKKIRPLCGK